MSKLSIWAEIMAERCRQDEKWGPNAQRTVSDEVRLCILAEEVGEVAQSINDIRNYDGSSCLHNELVEQLRKELVQVAACAVAWLEIMLQDGVRP